LSKKEKLRREKNKEKEKTVTHYPVRRDFFLKKF
jgi:hypothetical protein